MENPVENPVENPDHVVEKSLRSVENPVENSVENSVDMGIDLVGTTMVLEWVLSPSKQIAFTGFSVVQKIPCSCLHGAEASGVAPREPGHGVHRERSKSCHFLDIRMDWIGDLCGSTGDLGLSLWKTLWKTLDDCGKLTASGLPICGRL